GLQLEVTRRVLMSRKSRHLGSPQNTRSLQGIWPGRRTPPNITYCVLLLISVLWGSHSLYAASQAPRSRINQSNTTHSYVNPQLDRLPFSLYFVPFDAGTDAPVTASNAREYLQRVTVKRRSALESLYKHLQQEIAPGSEFHDGRIRLC